MVCCWGIHSPNDQLTVQRVEQDLARCLVGTEMLLVGNLNARLVYPRDQRKEDLVTAITNNGWSTRI